MCSVSRIWHNIPLLRTVLNYHLAPYREVMWSSSSSPQWPLCISREFSRRPGSSSVQWWVSVKVIWYLDVCSDVITPSKLSLISFQTIHTDSNWKGSLQISYARALVGVRISQLVKVWKADSYAGEVPRDDIPKQSVRNLTECKADSGLVPIKMEWLPWCHLSWHARNPP